MADSRTDRDYQDISDEIDSQRSDMNDSLLGRIRAMVDESSSSISSSHDVGSILTNLSRSASVRQLLDTPAGFRQPVHTGSGDLALVPTGSGVLHPKPDQITNLRLTREQLEAMHDTDLDWEMYGYGIDYVKKDNEGI